MVAACADARLACIDQHERIQARGKTRKVVSIEVSDLNDTSGQSDLITPLYATFCEQDTRTMDHVTWL